MASKKITVTLPLDQVAAIHQVIASGGSPTVSAFVQHAVAVALDDIAGWSTMLNEALAATGGALTTDEREWADAVLFGTGLPGSAASHAA